MAPVKAYLGALARRFDVQTMGEHARRIASDGGLGVREPSFRQAPDGAIGPTASAKPDVARRPLAPSA